MNHQSKIENQKSKMTVGKIGKNIKKIRNVKGLSQQTFAELFQLTRGNIASYEEERAEPKIEMVADIAKYFSIPLSDFILKDLSVNQLLHYNTELVLETEDLKRNHKLIPIPYVSALHLPEYITHYRDEEFVRQLPHIVIPNNSKFRLIALEVDNSENLPLGFDFKNGDIIFYENIVKENVHRIKGKFGMMVDNTGLYPGIFDEYEQQIFLCLNELVRYPFEIESAAQYWVLRAVYGVIGN
jgi:transcriptional regulator with XRE-family HTH domain